MVGNDGQTIAITESNVEIDDGGKKASSGEKVVGSVVDLVSNDSDINVGHVEGDMENIGCEVEGVGRLWRVMQRMLKFHVEHDVDIKEDDMENIDYDIDHDIDVKDDDV